MQKFCVAQAQYRFGLKTQLEAGRFRRTPLAKLETINYAPRSGTVRSIFMDGNYSHASQVTVHIPRGNLAAAFRWPAWFLVLINRLEYSQQTSQLSSSLLSPQPSTPLQRMAVDRHFLLSH